MQINKNLQALIKAMKDKKRGVVLEGSSRCFAAGQPVCTNFGLIHIQDMIPGNKVLSYNHDTHESEYKEILNVIVNHGNTKKCYKVKLKSGHTIIATHDHKFFFNGRYIELENILSLLKK